MKLIAEQRVEIRPTGNVARDILAPLRAAADSKNICQFLALLQSDLRFPQLFSESCKFLAVRFEYIRMEICTLPGLADLPGISSA
jgi:hypothetical protein